MRASLLSTSSSASKHERIAFDVKHNESEENPRNEVEGERKLLWTSWWNFPPRIVEMGKYCRRHRHFHTQRALRNLLFSFDPFSRKPFFRPPTPCHDSIDSLSGRPLSGGERKQNIPESIKFFCQLLTPNEISKASTWASWRGVREFEEGELVWIEIHDGILFVPRGRRVNRWLTWFRVSAGDSLWC